MCYVKSVNKGQLSPSPSSASSVVSATGATTTADQLTGLNFYTSAQTPNAFYSLGSDSTSSGVTTEGGLSLFDELAFFDSAPGTSPSLLSFLGTDGVGMSAGTPFNFMGTSTAPAPDLLWNTASLSPSSSLSGSSINNNAPVFKFETPEQAPLTPHPSLSPTLAGTEEVSSSTNTTTKKRSLQQAEGGESESVPEQLLIKRQRVGLFFVTRK